VDDVLAGYLAGLHGRCRCTSARMPAASLLVRPTRLTPWHGQRGWPALPNGCWRRASRGVHQLLPLYVHAVRPSHSAEARRNAASQALRPFSHRHDKRTASSMPGCKDELPPCSGW